MTSDWSSEVLSRWFAFLLAAVFCWSAVGCSSGPTAPSQNLADSEPMADEPGAEGEPAPVTKPIDLVKVDLAGYEAEIAKHQGKIVVVDFWATWCPPCVERFPHMVELSHQFDSDQVAFVSVSFDMPGQEGEAVKFLTQQNASGLTNLITSLDTGEAFEAYDIHDGIPNYKIYGRDGKLLHQFAQSAAPEKNVLAADDLDIKLREALAKD